MTEWIRNNVQRGCVRRNPSLRATTRKDRILSVVPGLAPRRVQFRCVPKQKLIRDNGRIETGDLIFFASTRSKLDVFHCGILVRNSDGVWLRHASRSQGKVVEQKLEEFLRQNRMPGAIVVRPVEAN